MKALFLAAALAAGPATAQIFVVHSEGERIEPLGVVPVAQRDVVRALTSMGAVEVGYVHSFFALYTIDFWNSDARYCLFMGDHYWEVSQEQAAQFLGVPASEVALPFTYWVPPGLLILMIGGAIVLLGKLYGQRLVDWMERRFPPDASDR